jgi:arylsulfatase
MGYQTPNIDRLAKEGMLFTDSYGEQSCTAGRASFITGQSGFRTGLTKVGMPGASVGLQKEDATIAELLKPLGYATGQFGKNHLGDRNEYMPTAHGFDGFFGNLYHLNCEEDPEDPDHPSEKEFPEFNKMFRPRGGCTPRTDDDPTEDPRFGPRLAQRIEDTGLLRKRMETTTTTLPQAVDFIKRKA